MGKNKLERFENYLCRIKIRPEYEGRPAKPGVSALNGIIMEMYCLWEYEPDEMYHGEYALSAVKQEDEDKLLKAGAAWLASGDLEFVDALERKQKGRNRK